MNSPFRIHLPKHLTQLDHTALPGAIRDVLFSGIAFQPEQHLIYRLPIAILEDSHFRGSTRLRRRLSYDRVDQLFVQISLPTDQFEIVEVFPHTTLLPGFADPELELGISIEPTTGKFSLTGTLKNLIRRNRHLIIHTHTSAIAQWAFQKSYLRDNFQINLDLLIYKRFGAPTDTHLVVEVKAQDGGRLIRSTRKTISSNIK